MKSQDSLRGIELFHHEGHEEHEGVKGTAYRATPTILGLVSDALHLRITQFNSLSNYILRALRGEFFVPCVLVHEDRQGDHILRGSSLPGTAIGKGQAPMPYCNCSVAEVERPSRAHEIGIGGIIEALDPFE